MEGQRSCLDAYQSFFQASGTAWKSPLSPHVKLGTDRQILAREMSPVWEELFRTCGTG